MALDIFFQSTSAPPISNGASLYVDSCEVGLLETEDLLRLRELPAPPMPMK